MFLDQFFADHEFVNESQHIVQVRRLQCGLCRERKRREHAAFSGNEYGTTQGISTVRVFGSRDVMAFSFLGFCQIYHFFDTVAFAERTSKKRSTDSSTLQTRFFQVKPDWLHFGFLFLQGTIFF